MPVILGLGSNIGDRLNNLRRAWQAIKSIPSIKVEQVSPLYLSDALLPHHAPPDWDIAYLNLALRCTTSLEPLALRDALKKIESQIGRGHDAERWAPRTIDIDILAWDDRQLQTEILTIPHKSLLDRPFALWPLADVTPRWLYQGKTAEQWAERFGSRFSGEAPCHTRQIEQRIDTPELVGVINVTPDSFADGGQFLQADLALQQALQLTAHGASVLDIGAESTAPSAKPIDVKTEWQRLEPVLQAIMSAKNSLLFPPKISVDTRHAEVAAKALAYGIDWVNDVSGLDDEAMRQVVANAKVDCVVMHHLHIPENREYSLPRDQDPLPLVLAFAEERIATLEKAGIARERIIFDPGIGFGKIAEQSLSLLQHISAFSTLGVRILVGHSRKSFFSLFTAMPSVQRDIETTAVSLYLATQPVNYLRLHNTEMCARAFKVSAALSS